MARGLVPKRTEGKRVKGGKRGRRTGSVPWNRGVKFEKDKPKYKKNIISE